MVDIHLFGKLRRFSRNHGSGGPCRLRVKPLPGETIGSLLKRLNIPADQVYSVFLNSKLLATRSSMAVWLGYRQVHDDPFDWRLNEPAAPGSRIGLFGRDMAALVV